MTVFFILDLIGTAIFAYTGAEAAKKQNFHALGVFYIAFLTAVGGGTVRSTLLQAPDLFWMKSTAYLMVVVAVVAVSYLRVMRFNTRRLWFYILDSQALAVFVALGTQVTLQQGQPLHIAFAMGILSGIGGGLIRDAVTSQRPQALTDPAYPVMMLTAAIGSGVSILLGLDAWILACAGVLVVVLIAATYHYIRTGTPLPGTQLENGNSRYSQTYLPANAPQKPSHVAGTELRQHRTRPVKHKSAFVAGTQALGVIGLSCIIGFYLFTPPSAKTSTAAPVAPVIATVVKNDRQNYQLLLSAANEHLKNRQLEKAELLVARLSLSKHAGSRLEHLKIKVSKLRTYLELLDKAELALATQNIPELQTAVTSATKLGFTDHRLQTLTMGLLNARERADIESAGKVLDQKNYELHLANATQYLAAGNLTLANAELTTARSLGIDSDALQRLESKINAQKQFEITPLSDEEYEYANQKFNQLAQAIKLRNIDAVSALTSGNERQQLFNSLFDRYIEINASVTSLSANNSKKIVSATLQLKNMRLPNGNLAYPPSDYGQISLFMQRTRQGWSRIQW